MILSRVWYVLLGLAVAVAMYTVYLAAGKYERQAKHALNEGLASDSQTVEWAFKIDTRRRLDALLAGSVDSALQQALVAANASKDGKVPSAAQSAAKKAIASVNDAMPADWRDDALFAVNRDGQVVASLGFDNVSDDFELGGYAAVNDAIHGWLRDDVWLLGSKMYVVVARPVEYDATQRPAGAIVGLKEINQRFASDLARRTRAAVAFYANGQRVAGGIGVEGFDEEKLDAVAADLQKIDDKTYGEGGRSEVRMLTDDLGAMYARLPGDVWSVGGGFAVARATTPLGGPLGFLGNVDARDKANAPWLLLAGVVLLSALVGIGLTIVEHSLPLRELLVQAERFRSGAVDGLQVPRFRGSYRLAAQALNQGMERSIEKAGGVTRKPADLESIIGPVPAQPAMSAFSFPMADGASRHSSAPPTHAPGIMGPAPQMAPPAPFTPPRPPPTQTPLMGVPAVMAPSPGASPHAGASVAVGRAADLREAAPYDSRGLGMAQPVPQAPMRAPVPGPARPQAQPGPIAPPPWPIPPPIGGAARPAPAPPAEEEDDDATMVGAVPAEVMAQATGEHKVVDDTAEWTAVYEDFIRTKKQCGESTDGLTFDKFSHTLRKNRDALIQRHGCKRVRFSVYVREGRASLKATPVKGV